jgi:hypothetical protein
MVVAIERAPEVNLGSNVGGCASASGRELKRATVARGNGAIVFWIGGGFMLAMEGPEEAATVR